MEKIQINKNNHKAYNQYIPIRDIYTDNIYLYISISGFYPIKAGDYVMFDRYVLSEDEGKNVDVYSKKKLVLYAYYDRDVITFNSGATFFVVRAEEKTLLRISEYRKETDNIGDYYVVTFEKPTNIFAQDIIYIKEDSIIRPTGQIGLPPTIQMFNSKNNTFEDIISEIYFNETNNIEGKKNYEFIVSGCQTPDNFIFNHYNQVDYNDCDKTSVNPSEEPMYYYLPHKTNNNVLCFRKSDIVGNEISAYTGQNLFYKYNPLYCQSDDVMIIEKGPFSGMSLYVCDFYDDVKGRSKLMHNIIVPSKVIDYWGVSVGLTNNNDYSHLYQETNITDLYVNNVREQIIGAAQTIDMEKMKFTPYCEETITSITYNLHFRQRDLDDNWSYIEDENIYWNPKLLEESGETIGLLPEDLNESGAVFSDMLYYLGFTDSDVMNQKQKIKKSFLRLSFYDSTDPLTQKLIYYSSIFMDSGEMFGTYIKAKNELIRNGKNGNNVVLNSQNSEKYRLDCKFTVKNEFNTNKSSDGFNIYYFPDDVPEMSGKTIYMKVEFNHAGYGRTIPMIVWPEDDLTIDTIKEGALYIPLTLNILEENGEKKYIYCFEENGEFIRKENNTMILNLVEPKLVN